MVVTFLHLNVSVSVFAVPLLHATKSASSAYCSEA